jgi:hypothetical protein
MNDFIDTLQPLLACPVCWGTDSNSMAGPNAGVLLMLFVLLSVFSAFGWFIFSLARRARKFADLEAAEIAAARASASPNR